MNALRIRTATPDDATAVAALLSTTARAFATAPEHRASLVPSRDDESLLVACAYERVVGCVRVRRAIGLDTPRWWYHVGCLVLAAPELRLFHRQRTLLLGSDHTGAAELADLACDPALAHPERSATYRALIEAASDALRRTCDGAARVIAELPGRSVDGASPFWSGLGRHFYNGDPRAAAARLGPEWRHHLAALLPRAPLLVSFLAEDAQAALGTTSAPVELVAALESCGLHAGQHVTIDDGGPVYEARLDAVNG